MAAISDKDFSFKMLSSQFGVQKAKSQEVAIFYKNVPLATSESTKSVLKKPGKWKKVKPEGSDSNLSIKVNQYHQAVKKVTFEESFRVDRKSRW